MAFKSEIFVILCIQVNEASVVLCLVSCVLILGCSDSRILGFSNARILGFSDSQMLDARMLRFLDSRILGCWILRFSDSRYSIFGNSILEFVICYLEFAFSMPRSNPHRPHFERTPSLCAFYT
jgi:hypothetical protein